MEVKNHQGERLLVAQKADPGDQNFITQNSRGGGPKYKGENEGGGIEWTKEFLT